MSEEQQVAATATSTEQGVPSNPPPPEYYRPEIRTPEKYHKEGITYVHYTSEEQMQDIMTMMDSELSEPYNIYTYRYFINNWPTLCWMAKDDETGDTIGAIVCKLDLVRGAYRGYIAMLAVKKSHRKRKIGSELVTRAIVEMDSSGADEVVLETEIDNYGALALYQRLGFIRDKRLNRYYLNGNDAYRLKVHLPPDEKKQEWIQSMEEKQRAFDEEMLQRQREMIDTFKNECSSEVEVK